MGCLRRMAVLATFAAFALTGCSSGDQDAEGPTSVITVENRRPRTPLEIFSESNIVQCDDKSRAIAQVRGAEPGETIRFTSPQPVDLGDGVADEDGHYWIEWRCGPEESRLRWDVTAIGVTSGNEANFTIIGGDELQPVQALTITPTEGPFLCDGTTRPVGLLTGAEPREEVEITSPERSLTRWRRSDDFGEIVLQWVCSPDEENLAWTLNAVAERSGRTGRLAIEGVAPGPGQIEELVFTVTEEPFACDRRSRSFAIVSNLAPNETVRIAGSGTDGVGDGVADAAGELQLRWQCGLGDVGRTWTLTVTGEQTKRSGIITVSGAAPPEGTFKPLEITFTEHPFRCDGESRSFAVLKNLLPLENVDFTSPQTDAIKSGRADADGALSVRWQCGAEDIGKVWELTAISATVGKSLTFSITGSAP